MPGIRLCAALLGLVAAATLCAAGADDVPEAELKAAFIYNFALFTEWPADALAGDGRFRICVAADSPLHAALAHLSGQPVHGRSVVLLDAAVPAQPGCQIAVVEGGSAPLRRGLLTVGDGASGAMIRLLLQDEHLRFDVDAAATRGAGLELSSKLLRLARTVQ
jgi:hypothetical protein